MRHTGFANHYELVRTKGRTKQFGHGHLQLRNVLLFVAADIRIETFGRTVCNLVVQERRIKPSQRAQGGYQQFDIIDLQGCILMIRVLPLQRNSEAIQGCIEADPVNLDVLGVFKLVLRGLGIFVDDIGTWQTCGGISNQCGSRCICGTRRCIHCLSRLKGPAQSGGCV